MSLIFARRKSSGANSTVLPPLNEQVAGFAFGRRRIVQREPLPVFTRHPAGSPDAASSNSAAGVLTTTGPSRPAETSTRRCALAASGPQRPATMAITASTLPIDSPLVFANNHITRIMHTNRIRAGAIGLRQSGASVPTSLAPKPFAPLRLRALLYARLWRPGGRRSPPRPSAHGEAGGDPLTGLWSGNAHHRERYRLQASRMSFPRKRMVRSSRTSAPVRSSASTGSELRVVYSICNVTGPGTV